MPERFWKDGRAADLARPPRDTMNEPDPAGDHAPREEEGPKPVPEILHSFYEGRPFVTCTRCGESLEHFEEGYRISKNFKLGEVILESAFCLPCLTAMFEETSTESREAIERFHEQHAREVPGFEECAFCETRFEEVADEEYGLIGICQGLSLHDSALICQTCSDRISELLSEETRRTWDRFREENFPGPPPGFALDLPQEKPARELASAEGASVRET